MSDFDYSKLKGKIKEVYCTQKDFARAIGLSETSISCKLNNGVDWKQEEIEKAMDLLKLPKNNIHEYFFTKKVEKITTKNKNKVS